MEDNPLFKDFDTPFGVPVFDRIENRHYLPAFEKGIELHDREIESIAGDTRSPEFENTIAALDRSGEFLDRVSNVFFGLLSANTNDEMQQIAKKVAPALSKHRDDILLNRSLFERVKAIYAKRGELDLTPEQKTLLRETYQDFVRGGADLDRDARKRLREINKRLSVLELEFREHVLKENNRFELVIENKEDLAGLPERVVAGAAKAAKDRGREGAWVFTLHKPSLIPFLQFSKRRELRRKMFEAYITKGDHNDDLDNKNILKEIIQLRIEKAELLGYRNYAGFKLARRMAKTPKNVYELLDRIWEKALPAARREAEQLQELVHKEGHDFVLEPWDWWYYAEKLRKRLYDLDENELRPYFELENVLHGVFDLANRLYGIRFVERHDLPKYNEDVRTFEVKDKDGSLLGVFYVDYFPRPSKSGGAWCGNYREEYKVGGRRIVPVVVNVGNFSMPTDDKPALLSFEEVRTLFHEFGHALHALFEDTVYKGSAENIDVDFVELPSQFMENWAAEPQVLKMYARHYKTGEPMPDALIAKIENSRHFNQGFETVEYMAACFLDMDWHMLEKPTDMDVRAFDKASMKKIGLIPQIAVRYHSTYFEHIFSGDFYAAGYYSYIWSQVLDADAFAAFKEAGLFNPEVAESFRTNVLSQGGAEDPMSLFVRFRGREPRIEPLLKRKGMLGTGK